MLRVRNIVLYGMFIMVLLSFINCCTMKREHLKPDNFFEERKYFNIAEAIYYNNDDLLKDYLKTYEDLDINKLGKRGANLLMYAVIVKERKMMQILLEHGADPNVKSYVIIPFREPIQENATGVCLYPLGRVVEYYEDYNKKYIELLLKYGADINDNSCYDPPFIYAVYSSAYRLEKKKELMTILLKNGANINIQNSSGETPLINCFGGSFPLDTIEWLLDHGADYKITDNDNYSVIHCIQDYLERNSDSGEKFLAKPKALKKRLENEGVIFPEYPFKVENGRMADIEYRK